MTSFSYIHCNKNGIPFYVGKGTLRRTKDFSSNRNPHYLRTIKKIKHENVLVGKLDCSSEEIAYRLEEGIIKILRRMKVKLTNMTDGGNGVRGWLPSEEYKAAMSLKTKGRVISEETKARMSKAQKGRKFSPESILKMSQADRSYLHERVGIKHPLFGTKASEKTRALLSSLKKGIPKPKVKCPHCKRLISINMINKWHNDACKFKVYSESRA